MKWLRLKMEGNGIVIWRVNAEIKLRSHWRLELILDREVGLGSYVKAVTIDHLVFYL